MRIAGDCSLLTSPLSSLPLPGWDKPWVGKGLRALLTADWALLRCLKSLLAGSVRGGGESRAPVRASGRDEEGFGLPPGSCRSVPCFSPRPGPAGSAGHRAQGATGRLSQGHAMTQSSWWKTTALVCHGVNGPAPSPPASPPPGDARGADTGPRCRPAFDLAALFQDITGNLNSNPSPQALPGSKSPLCPRRVSPRPSPFSPIC